MSRLAKKPIILPKGVEIKATKNGRLEIKGPKGTLHLQLHEGISLKVEGSEVTLERQENSELKNALLGLNWALLKNHIIGVSEGYEVRLSMIGVGYRASVQGNKLDLAIGNSHPTMLDIPSSLQVSVDKGVSILIKGIDKHTVGQFAAAVRAEKEPEPYKGKGIRYENEFVRKKEGKAAKGKA